MAQPSSSLLPSLHVEYNEKEDQRKHEIQPELKPKDTREPDPEPEPEKQPSEADAEKHHAAARTQTILDGFELLRHSGLLLPENVMTVRVEGKNRTYYTQTNKKDLEEFTELSDVHIVNHGFMYVDDFAKLPALQTLELSFCKICSIHRPSSTQTSREGGRAEAIDEHTMMQPCFQSLTQLNLEYNETLKEETFLDFSTACCPRLFELNVGHCALTTIPNGIQLNRLRKLNLEYNTLADNIDITWRVLSELPHLQTLNLSHNRLTRLPVLRGGFPFLKQLDISDNNFCKQNNIVGIFNIQNLQRVLLANDPLLNDTTALKLLSTYLVGRGVAVVVDKYGSLLPLLLSNKFIKKSASIQKLLPHQQIKQDSTDAMRAVTDSLQNELSLITAKQRHTKTTIASNELNRILSNFPARSPQIGIVQTKKIVQPRQPRHDYVSNAKPPLHGKRKIKVAKMYASMAPVLNTLKMHRDKIAEKS